MTYYFTSVLNISHTEAIGIVQVESSSLTAAKMKTLEVLKRAGQDEKSLSLRTYEMESEPEDLDLDRFYNQQQCEALGY